MFLGVRKAKAGASQPWQNSNLACIKGATMDYDILMAFVLIVSLFVVSAVWKIQSGNRRDLRGLRKLRGEK